MPDANGVAVARLSAQANNHANIVLPKDSNAYSKREGKK
jgi:hypothetical protein